MAHEVLGFDMAIAYKVGLENRAADALSRREAATTLMALSISCSLQLDEVIKAVEEDQA